MMSTKILKISLFVIFVSTLLFAQQEVFAQAQPELHEFLPLDSVESAPPPEILQPMVAGVFSFENTFFLFLLIPVAGYIMLRGDFHQIANLRIEKVLGICLVLLSAGSFLLFPFEDVVLQFVAGIFSLNNPSLLFLLIPVAGFIILRSEFDEVQYWQIQRILSCCVIVLLVSSIFIFPFSASPYYPYAFATNSTGQNVTTSTLSDIDGDGIADIIEETIPDTNQSDKAILGDIDGDGINDTVESTDYSGEPEDVWDEFMNESPESTDSTFSNQTIPADSSQDTTLENATSVNPISNLDNSTSSTDSSQSPTLENATSVNPISNLDNSM